MLRPIAIGPAVGRGGVGSPGDAVAGEVESCWLRPAGAVGPLGSKEVVQPLGVFWLAAPAEGGCTVTGVGAGDLPGGTPAGTDGFGGDGEIAPVVADRLRCLTFGCGEGVAAGGVPAGPGGAGAGGGAGGGGGTGAGGGAVGVLEGPFVGCHTHPEPWFQQVGELAYRPGVERQGFCRCVTATHPLGDKRCAWSRSALDA